MVLYAEGDDRDEFGGVAADDRSAENDSGSGVRDELDEAAGVVVDHGLGRRGERHFGHADLATVGEAAVMAGKLIAAPSTRIVQSYFPIQDVWLRNSGQPDHPISQVAQNVLLTRPEFDVQAFAISAETAAFLDALSDATVGTVIKAALTENPEFPLGDALALILQSGFATRLETDID